MFIFRFFEPINRTWQYTADLFAQNRLFLTYTVFEEFQFEAWKKANFQGEANRSAGLRGLPYNGVHLWTYNRRLSVRITLKLCENDTKSLYISSSVFFLQKKVFPKTFANFVAATAMLLGRIQLNLFNLSLYQHRRRKPPLRVLNLLHFVPAIGEKNVMALPNQEK